MALTPEEVRHIAQLARLGLSPEEMERLREQLSSILEHFQVLQELDTSGVPPTTFVLPLQSVFREDQPSASFPSEAILANAPRPEEGYFRVQAVLEE